MSTAPSHFNAPATPLRRDRFSNSNRASSGALQPSSALRNPYWPSPSKKSQAIYGTPPVTRTPSRVPAPPTPARAEPPPDTSVTYLPHQVVGRDPELLTLLDQHHEMLDRVIDQYSQMKLDSAHTLHVEMSAYEHGRTQAKCKLALLQKLVAESSEKAEKLKHEQSEAKKRVRGLVEDRRTMELKWSELKEVLHELERRKETLEVQKEVKKKEVGDVIEMAKEESKFLEEITGLKISVIAVDQLRFQFKLIDMNNYDRPFTLDLDLSSFDYQILSIEPPLPEASSILKELNQTRDFRQFLCRIRQCFVQLARTR
ncbi:chromosome segregation protein Spc25-domain-containing protein [Melampsora americana]|nr:chromosome segregation protein Spc25-domain-containing protein [Melampsora americana]